MTELLWQTHDALTQQLPEIEAAEAAAMLRYADILAELEQLGRRHKHTRESLAALERLIGPRGDAVNAATPKLQGISRKLREVPCQLMADAEKMDAYARNQRSSQEPA